MDMRIFAFIILCLLFIPTAAAADISVLPAEIIQGDPVMITLGTAVKPREILFASKPVASFPYQGIYRAFVAIDLLKQPGTYELYVRFGDGTEATKHITIHPRPKKEAPLGIPPKLGGNTEAAANALVNAIRKESATLVNIKTGAKHFWTRPFIPPLDTIIVTDTYGYGRQTVNYTIPHKGTDFRARTGTPVKAMNRGVVRIARTYIVYGKTVVVDHGLGLQTLYMHLSKINVNVGELVTPGKIIGLSGSTGYAEAPHLHLSVKINGISIDPMQFLRFFNPDLGL